MGIKFTALNIWTAVAVFLGISSLLGFVGFAINQNSKKSQLVAQNIAIGNKMSGTGMEYRLLDKFTRHFYQNSGTVNRSASYSIVLEIKQFPNDVCIVVLTVYNDGDAVEHSFLGNTSIGTEEFLNKAVVQLLDVYKKDLGISP